MSTQKRKAAKRRYTASSNAKSTSFSALAKSVGLALSVVAAVGLLLLFIGTALLGLTDDPGRYAPYLGTCLLFAAMFIGGAASVRFYYRVPLFCGLATGGAALLLLGLISLVLSRGNSQYPPLLRLALYAALPAVSTAGALLGNRKKKGRRRHR